MEILPMNTSRASHVAYADESYYTDERFRSVAVVTLESSNKEAFFKIFRALLDNSGIDEFKWNKLRQARERFAAIKLIDEVIRLAAIQQLRVDVLIWDTYDSRHQVQGRDDIANLQRMYYHLFKNVLLRRWPSKSTWNLFPGENSALDWTIVQDYLDTAGVSIEMASLFDPKPFSIRLSRDFQIVQIEEVSSILEPVCQVADMFAGIGAFSHTAYSKYRQWIDSINGQLQLGIDSYKILSLSNRERERFGIMKYLDDKCKTCRFHVSLKMAKGFKTFDPKFPINFWPYQPQHPDDKAPTK
jgi:hypothetical protein